VVDLAESVAAACFAFIRSRRDDFRDASSVFLAVSADAGTTNIETGACAFGVVGFFSACGSDFINVSFFCVGGGRIEWT
jgi:hypothetical protein